MSWKLKTDPENNDAPVIVDGKIIYIDPDGKELPLDPPAMYQKIAELGKENQKHRTKVDEQGAVLALFEGIDDITEWKKKADEALTTVENFNEKDWLKADKVEKLKKEMSDAYEGKLDAQKKGFLEKEQAFQNTIDTFKGQIRNLLVSNQFNVSKFFSGPNGDNEESVTLLPSSIGEAHFGKHFKVEDENGEPVIRAYYSDGEAVTSKLNPGESADFEEAMELILDKFSGKNSILRATAGGSGGGGGGGGDDHGAGGGSDLAKLKKQHTEATKNRDAAEAIRLKNRIAELEASQQQ